MSTDNTPRLFLGHGPRDFPEDWERDNDNGAYGHACYTCKQHFIGHKHRPPQCKMCEQAELARWNALTPEQQAEEQRRSDEEVARLLKEYRLTDLTP